MLQHPPQGHRGEKGLAAQTDRCNLDAFYVGNGWVAVAGMILDSDEMDHSRKFPAFDAPVSVTGE